MDAFVDYWDKDPVSFVILGVLLATVLSIGVPNLLRPGQIYMNIDRAVEKFARLLNMIAAAWIMVMAWVVLIDVIALANRTPIQGAREFLSNSVIAILFAQIPLAIRHGGMIRTTIVYDNAGPRIKGWIDGISFALGMIFFTAIAVGGWDNMVIGFDRKEFENVGKTTMALWPYRYITVWFSVLAALIYGLMFIKLFIRTYDERLAEEMEGAREIPVE